MTELRSPPLLSIQALTCSSFSLSSNSQMTSAPPELPLFPQQKAPTFKHISILGSFFLRFWHVLYVWSDAENMCNQFKTSATVSSGSHRCLQITYYSSICFLLQKIRFIGSPYRLIVGSNECPKSCRYSGTGKPVCDSGMFKTKRTDTGRC